MKKENKKTGLAQKFFLVEKKKEIEKKPLSVRFCDALISVCLFLSFFVTPLFFLNLTAQGLAFEKYVFLTVILLIGLIAWATKSVILGSAKIKRSFLDWPVLFFLLALAGATIFSVEKGVSFLGDFASPGKGFLGVLTMFLFVYFLANNFSKRRQRYVLLGLVASNFFFLVFFALLRFEEIAGFLRLSAVFSPLGTTVTASVFVGALIPLLMALIIGAGKIFWERGGWFLKGVFMLTLAADLVFLFLINLFVFWPALIAGTLVFLVFLVSKIVKTGRPSYWPIAVFLLLVFFYVVGDIKLVNLKLPAEVGPSHAASWQIAKKSAGESLVFGSGPSTFKYDFAKFKPQTLNLTGAWNVYFDTAQGAFFEVLATLGLAGLLTLVLLLAAFLLTAVWVLVKARKNSDKLLLAGSLGAFSVFVFSAFYLSFNSILILLAFFFGGLLYAAVLRTKGFKFPVVNLNIRASAQNAILLASVFLFVSAGVVVFFALLTRTFAADYYAKKADQAPNLETAIKQMTASVQLADYQAVYYSRLGQYYMALVNEEVAKPEAEFDRVKALSYLQTAIASSRQALALKSEDVEVVAAMASIYENATLYVSDAQQFARDNYLKMSELEPVNPIPHIRLGVLIQNAITEGTSEEEKEQILSQTILHYQRALELKPDLAGVYSGIAFAYEQMKDMDKAIIGMARAIELSSQNLGYRFELARLYFNRGIKTAAVLQAPENQQQLIQGEGVPQEQLSVEPPSQTAGSSKMNEDLKTAENILINLTEVYPDYANAHYLLGVLYEQVGRRAEARERYQKTVLLLPEGKDKEAVEERIKKL